MEVMRSKSVHLFKLKKKINIIKRYKLHYLLIMPGILYFIIFCYLPMYGVTIAFKNIETIATLETILKAPFVGFYQFKKFMSSYYFLNIMGNTISISLLRILFGFPAPILLALLLNEVRQKMFKRVVQTISYMPHFISMVVLTSLTAILLSPQGGLVNRVLEGVGMESVYFLGDDRYFRWILIITGIWKDAGWGTIIYLAAISGVSEELFDAAMVDGAKRLRQVCHIILPSIMPVAVIMLILSVGGIMNAGFEQILLLYSPPVYNVADIIDTYVYRMGIVNANYSFSTAVGLFKSGIAVVLLLMTNFIAKKISDVGIW